MSQTRAVVLTPFEESYQGVRDTVQGALRASQVEPILVDRVATKGAQTANAVNDAIQGADLVVADVSKSNSNVFYELGFAHALRKPTILLADSGSFDGAGFDFSGLRVLVYDRSKLPDLGRDVSRFAKSYFRRPAV